MITPIEIRSKISAFLEGGAAADDLIKCIDDAVSTDAVYEYSDSLQDIVMRYQDLLALYVENEAERSESSAFYGPERLREIVGALKRELDAVDLSG